MRTTLKRGIGRAPGLNGNGHSVVPPLFGPITRYRQPEPPSRSFVGLVVRGFGWFVLAVAVLASGIGGGLYLYTHESLNAVKAHTKAVVNAEKKLTPLPSPNQPAIALIAGYDHRAGTGTNSYAGSNSDTLMLVRADPTNHTLSLLSLPRDLAVNIYCKGDTISTQNRINAAWAVCGANGGPYAAVDTMEHLTGLKINYLITLDFRAFKMLVNRLHGVYMNIDRRYYNPPHDGWAAINLHPGYQKLDGGQALSFVRFRHFDSDLYRTGRQQLFIEALKSRMRSSISLSNILEVPRLIAALKGNLEIAKAGGGAVTPSELLSYLGLAYHLPAGHLLRNSIPLQDFQPYTGAGGAAELTTSPEAIQAAVQSFLHPAVPGSKQTSGKSSSSAKTSTTRTLPRKQISVLVLNAGNVAGEAANTTYLLTQRGYATKTLPATVAANAPAVKSQTIVYYDPVQPHAKQAAQELKPLFGSGTGIVQMTPAIAAFAQKAGDPLTVVAVGTSFSGKLTIPPKPKKPVPSAPAQVSDGVSVTATAIRGLAGQAHFPLVVPHAVALGAQLSTDEGVRLFKPLRGRQELALTFTMPNGIYWQVEETNWSSAPILASPTYHFPYRGRTFDVYTTSGAIQMVALRTPKASYVVINSILNELSNSTMLAIAKSLTPLGK
jgi:LCP family protein required for cell wall assembly